MRRNTVFGQIMQLLSQREFRRIVAIYDGDKYTKKLDCWQQLVILLYGMIKDMQSLREIVTSLRSRTDDWGQLGLESVARSTLADANAGRSCKIYEELFYRFLGRCQSLSPSHGFRIRMPVFTQDATVIPLCLSAFPWARYRRRKGALKLHMLLDHKGCLPSFIRMTEGRVHDVNVVKNAKFDFPALPPDSILTVDRGYIDYGWLHSLHSQGIVFIVRSKSNMAYRILGQHKKPNKKRSIISDQLIEFTNYYEKQAYGETLRLIRYQYKDKNGIDREVAVITNNLSLAATTIAALYKGRWEIETFFRWIKQNLRIKSFLGTSQNAVMTQVWVAMILYLLLTFIKFQTKFSAPLSELLRILREILLDTRSMIEYMRMNWGHFVKIRAAPRQLALF